VLLLLGFTGSHRIIVEPLLPGDVEIVPRIIVFEVGFGIGFKIFFWDQFLIGVAHTNMNNSIVFNRIQLLQYE